MDALGLPFVLACLIAYCGFVLIVARICGLNERKARLQREAERHEVDGNFASIIDFASEREARVNRARFRYATRHGKGDVA